MPQTSIVIEPLVLQYYLFFTTQPKPQYPPKGMTHSTVLHSQTATAKVPGFGQHLSAVQVRCCLIPAKGSAGLPQKNAFGTKAKILRMDFFIFSCKHQEVNSCMIWLFHILRKIKAFCLFVLMKFCKIHPCSKIHKSFSKELDRKKKSAN